MLVGWVKDFDSLLPDEVVRREFELYLTYFEKGLAP